MSKTVPVFQPLYIINAHQKVYKWTIEIKKKAENVYTIVTSHGENDGKMIVHERDIEEGKGKKTVLEQATQEANRKWKNKVEKELYSTNLENVAEDKQPIVVRPMLANKFSFEAYEKKGKAYKIPFPAYIQPKLDGLRCVSYIKNGEVIIESRTGMKYQNFGPLKSELKELFKKLPKNFYFDGELYTDEIPFETISGLIRQHEDKVTEEDLKLINMIKYYIYDFVDLDKLDLTFEERNAYLSKNLAQSAHIMPVETILLDDYTDVQKYHDTYVQDGFEGVMVRAKEGIYEINKRSKYLQKYKEFFEDEFKIVGFHDEDGQKGAVIWEIITKYDVKVDITPRGSLEYRRELFKNGNSYIGKLLTVIHFGYTNKGSLRIPKGKAIRENY
jgi:DNA ligase-1